MINKKLLASIFLSILLTFNAFAAGSSDSGSSKTKTQYDMAVSHINAAKKFEQKNKLDKAKKRYEKAQKLLIKSNKKFPNKADTLNYLGFTTRKLGDFENGKNKLYQSKRAGGDLQRCITRTAFLLFCHESPFQIGY